MKRIVVCFLLSVILGASLQANGFECSEPSLVRLHELAQSDISSIDNSLRKIESSGPDLSRDLKRTRKEALASTTIISGISAVTLAAILGFGGYHLGVYIAEKNQLSGVVERGLGTAGGGVLGLIVGAFGLPVFVSRIGKTELLRLETAHKTVLETSPEELPVVQTSELLAVYENLRLRFQEAEEVVVSNFEKTTQSIESESLDFGNWRAYRLLQAQELTNETRSLVLRKQRKSATIFNDLAEALCKKMI
ncbi:MAG: hypothetical protein AB7F43_10880 [Bacteriovoracia bacterium]